MAALRPAGQRWLKTALQTIRTMPVEAEREERLGWGAELRRELDAEPRYRPPLPERLPPSAHKDRPRRRSEERPEPERRREERPHDLDDVIAGRASMEDELANYPELAGELEGLGDIINMLRDLGQSRRKRGEEILREDILGKEEEEEE